FLKTDYSKTEAGRINANDYLVAANRYQEAADNYRCLDKMMADAGMDMSLDNIQRYMLPKYMANAEAGRGDSARVAARRILLNLDEAITGQKNSAMAELATIYDTQGKETEIARQQVEMSKQRLMATAIAMILVFTFFIIYTLHKRNSTHKLAAAHEELQKAYDRLEETTTAKERIESELRIARDIQMSMVPNVSPDRDGLDLYATMTPAKEVGGDLYGYLLIGDDLYFCVGDVSGKGVPASLFMAQATRLFRTLAAQKMMPAEIATRMNDALTENNERGMFVTMFLGLVNLESGRLDFCNAGHNPPVIYDQVKLGSFIEMESNAPIGLWPDLEYVGESIENIKGKPLFVYTDGLNEAENPNQEQFGDERMLEFLHHAHFKNAEELVETLKAEVERFRDGADPNDDMTMLCLKVK
ncbi:MAG: serine/threonine-protein phosphatase, partial [Prevotella sp.]|nr:serine/threonine-protein phosphatase [Prevotella sp.]